MATNAKYVMPNLKHMTQLIIYAHKQTQKHRLSAGYMFYETSQGFYFRSLAPMMSYGGNKCT